MGLAEESVEAIEIAGVIRDIGKLYVPAEILSKPTKLTDLEYALIKMHAQAGFTILSKIDFPWPIARIVHEHHELVNGSGYPQGLRRQGHPPRGPDPLRRGRRRGHVLPPSLPPGPGRRGRPRRDLAEAGHPLRPRSRRRLPAPVPRQAVQVRLNAAAARPLEFPRPHGLRCARDERHAGGPAMKIADALARCPGPAVRLPPAARTGPPTSPTSSPTRSSRASAPEREPGAGILVLRDGKVVYLGTRGVAELQGLRPIDGRTSFRLASVTKQFTAMAVMLLVRDGKLRYEDSLTGLFPDFPDYGAGITVRHLLNHTSGLPDHEDLDAGRRPGRAGRGGADRRRRGPPSSWKASRPAGSSPGALWRYSNSGYVLLGLIVAKVSGRSFPTFLRERIFRPSEMPRHRGLRPRPDSRPRPRPSATRRRAAAGASPTRARPRRPSGTAGSIPRSTISRFGTKRSAATCLLSEEDDMRPPEPRARPGQGSDRPGRASRPTTASAGSSTGGRGMPGCGTTGRRRRDSDGHPTLHGRRPHGHRPGQPLRRRGHGHGPQGGRVLLKGRELAIGDGRGNALVPAVEMTDQRQDGLGRQALELRADLVSACRSLL
ncbi:MAG: serine hydrolase [Desulfomicrobium escambiense]|nr:serine hydrolase [Desulfomicrobium escambiense]